MAIMESERRPSELPETVSDLLKGFAILAGALGSSLPVDDAFALRNVAHDLLERAERMGWEESVDLLLEADRSLDRRVARRD